MRKKPLHYVEKPRPGKKPGLHGKKLKKLYSISPDIADYLDFEISNGTSASALIEALIRKSKEFKSWQLTKGQS